MKTKFWIPPAAGIGAIAALSVLLARGASHEPLVLDPQFAAVESPGAADEMPPVRVPVAEATEPPKEVSPPAPVPKPEKTTVLPDGKVLIENKKVTLRYMDGRVEERYVKITATPVKKPMEAFQRGKGGKIGKKLGSPEK